MRTLTHVLLDKSERERLLRVLNSITIAYPEYRELEDTRGHPVRRLASIAKGGDASRDHLDTALEVVRQQAEVCRCQGDEAYWREAFGDDAERGPLPEGALPLVLDPEQMVKALADARTMQTLEAAQAEELLLAALDLIPEGEEVVA